LGLPAGPQHPGDVAGDARFLGDDDDGHWGVRSVTIVVVQCPPVLARDSRTAVADRFARQAVVGEWVSGAIAN
jgi:hypothetical protein